MQINPGIYDTQGVQMASSLKKIRLPDYLILTDFEKSLQSTSKGSAETLTITSIVLIIAGIVFEKSLS